ncbi:competence type IV pilus ATPase ComGA [Staphylococcus hyicus]|uniref:competence type IV pilus ATPase ComGA n=1 Tax=Staphylococcus hyicus TaxID=1284 RepID=UPI00057F1ED8|nr:competence type IV pilus ATPase ComGA [Staphylococcus hyicus]AJC96113.1 competence protein ComGA [Staphylococcus hyicus]MCQ9290875.1 competence type IV pilus ATPase ComGA [Staphylococcus hyicus]MCQ9306116.1 competence type IV pilus ATPase ComGA [Staphylococcus hyicus]MCQ9308529.1 competence type IV pilus ATPase ComGA [Staphylococcus hyicus]MCQ9310950.1 competence type IV pilus ATPase ComGA [Staphylococcus hyicus]
MQLLIDHVVQYAITHEASDIHFIPNSSQVDVKLRIKDYLKPFDTLNLETYQKMLTLLKFKAGLDVSSRHKAQSGRYIYEYETLYYLRVSTLPLNLGNESCVIRITPQLFHTDINQTAYDIQKTMEKKQGLILFSGPTGAGKSTLMYQMVVYAKEKLNLNIITIEDPVEQLLNGVTQISVNEKADITYGSSLKAILRCDPDVILIGEIRDGLIAKDVIQASLSGHLVLSTIHANDCKGVLLRLIEMGITKQDLLQALNLIVNQRLITTNDNSRKLVYELMSQDDIRYFLDHNFVLPKHFESLNDKLTELKKKGEIDDVTLRKYQK